MVSCGGFAMDKLQYILEAATDETLNTEDSVAGIHGNLFLGRITDQALPSREGDIRRRCSVTLCGKISAAVRCMIKDTDDHSQ